MENVLIKPKKTLVENYIVILQVFCPGAAGSLVCVVMRDSAGSYRTEKAGGLATSVIVPRKARILEDGAVCICLKAMIGPLC